LGSSFSEAIAFPTIEEKSRPSSSKASLSSSFIRFPSQTKKTSSKLDKIENDVDYEKVLSLFTDKHTKDLASRQAATLTRVARSKKAGYRIIELEDISKLMHLALDRISSPDSKDLFSEPLELFIRLFAQPFVAELKVPDLDKSALISSCFSVFEKVISLNIPPLIRAVVETLPVFAHHSAKTVDPVENLKVILEKDLIPALLRVFPQYLEGVVSCFHALSKYPLAALKLGESGLLDQISLPLEADFRKESVLLSVETLLNILEAVPISSFSTWFLPNAESIISSLRRLVTDVLSLGHRLEDKEARNTFVVVLSLLARIPGCASYCALSDILRPLLATVTAPELSAVMQNSTVQSVAAPSLAKMPTEISVPSFTSSTDDLDLELKRLVWHLSGLLVNDPFCHSQIAASQLLSCALVFLDIVPEPALSPSYNPHSAVQRWLLSQQLELQWDALRLVSALASELPGEFVAQNGPQRLMRLVMYVTQNPANHPGRALTAEQYASLRVAALNCLAVSW
jgi:hypothetical protein